MARPRTRPLQLAAPPVAVGLINPPFHAGDVGELAEKAGLTVHSDAEANSIAGEMNKALASAHHAQLMAQDSPAPSLLRDAMEAVSGNSRELLLALGLSVDHAATMGLDRASIARQSGVLRAMLRRVNGTSLTPLPMETLAWLHGDNIRESERQRITAQCYIVEAARAVAFLAACAEGALVGQPRPGPVPDVFKRQFLEGLARVHHVTFGRWPTLPREKGIGDERGGPSLRWLREVLRLLPGRGFSVMPKSDLLTAGLARMAENSMETLGSDFEKATARARKAVNAP